MTTSSTTMPAPAPLSRDEAGSLLGHTMGLVALTAGLFALGAYIGRGMSGGWAILCFVLAFAVLVGMHFAAQRSDQLAVTRFPSSPGGSRRARGVHELTLNDPRNVLKPGNAWRGRVSQLL